MDLQAKWDLVGRITAGTTFRKAPRLREFLKYVAECTLAGRPEDAREQQIALRVFKRTPEDQPRQDNIVRVEARSLRKRLECYFAGEGRDEPVVILMPKGGYTLSFEPRPQPVTTDFTMQLSETSAPVPRPLLSRPPVRIGLALAAVLAVLYLMLILAQRNLHRGLRSGRPATIQQA